MTPYQFGQDLREKLAVNPRALQSVAKAVTGMAAPAAAGLARHSDDAASAVSRLSAAQRAGMQHMHANGQAFALRPGQIGTSPVPAWLRNNQTAAAGINPATGVRFGAKAPAAPAPVPPPAR